MRRIKTFRELFEGATKKDKGDFPTLETLENLPIYKKAKKFLGDPTVGSSPGVRKFSFGTNYACFLKPSGDGNANLVYGTIMIEKNIPFSTPYEMDSAMTRLILYSIAQNNYISKIPYSASKSAVFNGDFDELNSAIKRILNKLSKESLWSSSEYDSRGHSKGSLGIININNQFRQLEFIMSLPGVKSGINTKIKPNSSLADNLVRTAIKLDNLDGLLCLSDLGIVNGKKIEDILDDHFKRNQEDLYLLDDHPDMKDGVLKRTGIEDLSKSGRESNKVKWLNECTDGTWKINPTNGLVDVNGNFRCKKWGIKNFQGVKFGHVTGYFDCSGNQITSLKGAPQTIDGYFNCDDNNLVTLEGAPNKSGGLSFKNNKLESLIGSPQEVAVFNCSGNNLKSLKGGPERVSGEYICTDNQLTSLEGAPRTTGGIFNCNNNKLKTLKGGPVATGRFECINNELKTLEGGPETVSGSFVCYYNDLESLKGAPKNLAEYFIFSIEGKQYIIEENKWNFNGWIDFIKKHPKAFSLFEPIMGDDALDRYFKNNPLELHILNPYPDIKSGVLKRTGIKDYSKIGLLLNKGLV